MRKWSKKSGYHQFDQSKMKLEINTPSAQILDTFIQYVIRAVFDASVLTFRFKYKNKRSTGLGFNATTVQIQNEWNSLMNEFGYQCTALTPSFDANAVVNITVKTMAGQNVTKESFDELPELEIQSTNVNGWHPFVTLNNANSGTAQWLSAPVPCEISIYSLQLKIIEQDASKLSIYDIV